MNQLFKSQLKRESKKLTHDQFKIPKSSTSVYTNKNSYLGALLRSANLALLFFLFTFVFCHSDMNSSRFPRYNWRQSGQRDKRRGRSSKQLAFLHALERAMRNGKERKERDKDARGRELINWLKDTHILFSMTLSGGDVTWW